MGASGDPRQWDAGVVEQGSQEDDRWTSLLYSVLFQLFKDFQTDSNLNDAKMAI
jgi:hypothetical protein